MRRVFLDVGAYDGASVRFFRDNCREADQFEIFCFEPLPLNVEKLARIPNITIVPKAAWSSEGSRILFVGGKKEKGSTLFPDKSTGLIDVSNAQEVRTFDFAQYVQEHFEESDELWLKLNVEGAEYEIIPHLKRHGLLSWFNRIYVMWHAYKIPSLQARHDAVVAMVPEAICVWRKKTITPLC